MDNKYLPTRKSNKLCLLFLGLLMIIWIIDSVYISFYIYKPLLWLSISLLVWYLPRFRPAIKIKDRNIIYWWAFNCGIIFIMVQVLVGLLIDGLGKSPFSHEPLSLLVNIFHLASGIIARELIRGYIVNSSIKKENFLKIGLVAIFMTLTSLSLRTLIDFKDFQDGVIYLGQYILPDLVENLLATYLVYLAGPLASIIYLGIIEGFHWLSPILPDLQWISKSLIGILLPVFFLMTFQNLHIKLRGLKNKDREEINILSWILASGFAIGIIWFVVGVFPIYPTVIVTSSMEPTIKTGDIVLIRKVSDMEEVKTLREEDILLFNRGQVFVTHRIIGIIDDDQGRGFKTKGDNNSGPDNQILRPEDIRGRVVSIIPKLGKLTLLFRARDKAPIDDLVF